MRRSVLLEFSRMRGWGGSLAPRGSAVGIWVSALIEVKDYSDLVRFSQIYSDVGLAGGAVSWRFGWLLNFLEVLLTPTSSY